MSKLDKISLPGIKKKKGTVHPINQTQEHLIDLLRSFGFQVADGPEIETEEFNFDMLNIKKSHPARQMHDTFILKIKPMF